MNARRHISSEVRTSDCAPFVFAVVAALLLGGCATSYVTPGRAADLSAFGVTEDLRRALADGGVQAMFDRKPAAARADMLLIYTIDTVFSFEDGMRPLNVLTLGLFPTKDVRVNTTASAILIDTRNAYLYGSAEATTDRTRLANAWTSRDAAEKIRRTTEREALEAPLDDCERAWGQVVTTYGTPRRSAAAAPRG